MPSNDPASDRDRAIVAAVEASVGAVLSLGGGLVVVLAPGIMIVGVVLLVLGVVGVIHGLAIGLGLIRLPPSRPR